MRRTSGAGVGEALSFGHLPEFKERTHDHPAPAYGLRNSAD